MPSGSDGVMATSLLGLSCGPAAAAAPNMAALLLLLGLGLAGGQAGPRRAILLQAAARPRDAAAAARCVRACARCGVSVCLCVCVCACVCLYCVVCGSGCRCLLSPKTVGCLLVNDSAVAVTGK
jgi:hypothetical protein